MHAHVSWSPDCVVTLKKTDFFLQVATQEKFYRHSFEHQTKIGISLTGVCSILFDEIHFEKENGKFIYSLLEVQSIIYKVLTLQ